MEGYGKILAPVAREFVEGIGVEFELDEPEKNDMEEELKKFRLSVARKKSTRPAPGRRRRGRGPFL